MRVVDGLPLAYVPTLIGILVTARNQRPGDLAAGTLVIREDRRRAGALAGEGGRVGAPAREESVSRR